MTPNELFTKINSSFEYYDVVLVDRALGEDGVYIEGEGVGYGLVNRVTGITEHTSTMLPGVFWQGQHFEGTLKSLLEVEAQPDTTAADSDILPFKPH